MMNHQITVKEPNSIATLNDQRISWRKTIAVDLSSVVDGTAALENQGFVNYSDYHSLGLINR